MNTTAKSGRQVSGKKSSEGGRGNPEKASPAAVERYLKGMTYPASRDELIAHAEDNDAPDDVLTVLNKFSEHEYHSPIDVSKEVGKLS